MSADRLLAIRNLLVDMAQSGADPDEIARLLQEEKELEVALGPEVTSLVGYPTGYFLWFI